MSKQKFEYVLHVLYLMSNDINIMHLSTIGRYVTVMNWIRSSKLPTYRKYL